MITGDALVFTLGLLDQNFAKTAHGLIRGSDRFKVKAVVDPVFARRDAGEVMDGKKRGITVYGSIDEALKKSPGSEICYRGNSSYRRKTAQRINRTIIEFSSTRIIYHQWIA
jgi:hypothetical protein